MCAASGSTLGKEKIKMKKEVVDIRSNNYLTICIILHKYFIIVVIMLTNCKQMTIFAKSVQFSGLFQLFWSKKALNPLYAI